MKVYNFGKTEFSSNVWIGGASPRTFKDPRSVHLMPKGNNRVTIVVYNSTGTTEYGRITTPNFEYDTNFPIGHISQGRLCRIRLYVARYLNPVTLNGGQVYYNG